MKKINKGILIAAVAVVLIVAAVCLLPGLTGDMRAYGLLNDLLQREEWTLDLALDVKTGGEEIRFDAMVEKFPVSGHSVTAVTRDGSGLYFSGGAVFLQDGTAYTLQAQESDYSTMLELMIEALAGAKITESKGVYTITAEGDRARSILRVLLEDHAVEAESLTVEMVTQNEAITQIRVEIHGDVEVNAVLTVKDLAQAALPEPVRSKIETGDFSGTDISAHLSQLADVFAALESRDAVTVAGTLTSELGFLPLTQDVTFYAWKVDGRTILGVDSGLMKRYYSDAAVCDEQGRLVAEKRENLNVQQILDLLWQLAAGGQITFGQSGGSYTCVLAPGADVMAMLAHTMLPDTADMDIVFHTGTIGLQVEEGQLITVYVRVSGTTKVLLFDTDVALELDLRPVEAEAALPQAVIDVLLP